jgi:hypothetical protein
MLATSIAFFSIAAITAGCAVCTLIGGESPKRSPSQRNHRLRQHAAVAFETTSGSVSRDILREGANQRPRIQPIAKLSLPPDLRDLLRAAANGEKAADIDSSA